MKLLNKEEILGLSYQQCQRQIKQLAKTYNLNEPLIGNPQFEQIWEQLEDICNNLLWLEDRIAQYESARFTTLQMEQPAE